MAASGPGWVDRLGLRVLKTIGYDSRALETSVGPIHLLSREGRGSSPPVLLVHGFGAAALHWVPLVRALKPHVRQICALDLPGHGFSHRPDALTVATLREGVIEALDRAHALELVRGPAIVVGNSLGGAVALRYVHARPDRVHGAVLLSPGGAPLDPDELAQVQRLFRVETHAQARAFLDTLHAKPLGLIGHVIAPFVRQVFRDPVLHGLLEGVGEGDWIRPDEIRSFPAPLRVLWGRYDRILPRSSLAFWRQHLPDHAEIDEPDAFGHAPQLDAAGALADDIVAFARRLASQGAGRASPTTSAASPD